jgi:hypothetical protein
MRFRIACMLAAGLVLARIAPADVPAARSAAPSTPGTAAPSPARPATPPAATDSAPPPAPGLPNFVAVVFDGLGADSVRAPFMAGFRGAFSDPTFSTDRPSVRTSERLPGLPLSNRFRLLEGTPATGTWQAQVAIEWLKPGEAAAESSGAEAATSGREAPAKPKSAIGRAQAVTKAKKAKIIASNFPGARVTYWAISPEAVAAGVRVIPDRETLRFRFQPAAGPKFWSQAGRRAALLLIEKLHHLSEDLGADIQIKLDDCDRGGP